MSPGKFNLEKELQLDKSKKSDCGSPRLANAYRFFSVFLKYRDTALLKWSLISLPPCLLLSFLFFFLSSFFFFLPSFFFLPKYLPLYLPISSTVQTKETDLTFKRRCLHKQSSLQNSLGNNFKNKHWGLKMMAKLLSTLHSSLWFESL